MKHERPDATPIRPALLEAWGYELGQDDDYHELWGYRAVQSLGPDPFTESDAIDVIHATCDVSREIAADIFDLYIVGFTKPVGNGFQYQLADAWGNV